MKAKYLFIRIIQYLYIIHVFYGIHAQSKINSRRIARKEGDVIFGALFPLHQMPDDTSSYTRTCGHIWEQYGIHRTELFLKTLDEINANPDLLPNITVGYDIRDSCWYSPVALEQSIDFIKDYLASRVEHNVTTKDACSQKARKPIIGLIGPGSSKNTIQVQNLLQIFRVPQIGFSATSIDLSDKNYYKYFLRVVPSDKYQAQAMMDVVLRYNWTYISVVHSDGNYGLKGIEEFKRLARNNSICISNDEGIDSTGNDKEYDELVKNMLKNRNARVVVCFCEGKTVTKLMQAILRAPKAKGHFLVLGSDGWADRHDVVKTREEAAAGGISIKLHSPIIDWFDEYFFKLNPFNNPRNPWFEEFWEFKFNCTMSPNTLLPSQKKPCTGNEDIEKDFHQDSKLGFVYNAIYAMAHALHNLHNEICGGVPGMCKGMDPVEGSLYLHNLLNVSMKTYSGYNLNFDANGDPPARYDIMNFQKFDENGNMSYGYRKVGSWGMGQLKMNDNLVYWPDGRDSGILVSICSRPCAKGSIKKIEGNKKCCWTCIPCQESEIMLDEETCQACPPGTWPNDELTVCKRITTEYLSWFDTEALVAISLACFGIFVTLWIILIFVRHHNTPVVKASTRELSYIIMLGIIIAFCCNFVLVSKPTIVSCYFTRILPGISFSLIYGALVTKTNRIARILEGTKKIITKKPRFMSASAQVIITCILVGIECAIITVMLIIEPADSKLDYPSNKRVRLVCNTTTLGIVVPLGFDLILILMCTLYAVKTRNLPENFNEAKFIGFTMYTTCVIWLGFFAIYFGSDSTVLTMSVTISLSASVALVLLFFPKVYVIVWAPEKNTRSAFTTSKDVRCHIGSISFHSGDSMDMIRGKKSMDGKNYRRRSLFGKTRSKPKDAMAARRQSASLPPNIRLNRQNSTHVPATKTNSNGNQKFPWTQKDKTPTDDGEDRLSTISSKEESHSHGSDKKKGFKKQDSQCQTESDLFDPPLPRSKNGKKNSSLRRRHRRNSTDEGKCDSDSSIDSDEIFLSLPPADLREKRGMYKTGCPAHHSDKSPLLGVSEAYNDSCQTEIVSPGVAYNKSDMNESYNFMSNFQKQGNPREKNLMPYSSSSYTTTNEIHPSSDQLREKQIYSHCNQTSESVPTQVSTAPHNHVIVNGQYCCVPPAFQTCIHSVGAFNLRPDESALYGRRHSGGFVQEPVGTVIKRRNTNPDKRSPRPHKRCEQTQSLHENSLRTSLKPYCGHNCSRQVADVHNCCHDDRVGTGTSWIIPAPPSAFTSRTEEVLHDHTDVLHIPGRHSDLVPNRSSCPSAHHPSSAIGQEDTVSSGLNRLDEEEVSMISFQTYLKNHGIELDMSSVQSSDV